MTPKPWYHKGLRFDCRQCGACCESHGEYSHLYMMPEEVTAMASHVGLTEAAFREAYCAEEDGWTVLRSDHPRCPFLGEENRCDVYPVRPMQCRSWPFWQENLKREVWQNEVQKTCPGAGSGRLHSRTEVEHIAQRNEDWYEG